jgi:protein-S-isoprenylcysteine O-methyltransferase Ste14
MKGLLSATYSAVVYLFFLATFLYAIGFVEGVFVPTTIDIGAAAPLLTAVLIDLALLGVFAVQHSVMARPAFKRVWTKIVPEAIERSTYVLLASLALALLLWQWRPIPQLVWSVDQPIAAAALRGLSWAGWATVLASTFLISHFHLFGLSQGFAGLLGLKPAEGQFVTPLFYRWVRHPLYLGFIVAFWAAPQMSLGHLLFAAATTVYILLGIFLEERDLVATFGGRYLEYRAQTGMLLPKIGGRRGPVSARSFTLRPPARGR